MMVSVAWLVLFTAWEPAPTFMVVETFKSQQECVEARQAFITDQHINEKQAAKIQCLTLTTSILKDA